MAFFTDLFRRGNSDTVGNNWTESEPQNSGCRVADEKLILANGCCVYQSDLFPSIFKRIQATIQLELNTGHETCGIIVAGENLDSNSILVGFDSGAPPRLTIIKNGIVIDDVSGSFLSDILTTSVDVIYQSSSLLTVKVNNIIIYNGIVSQSGISHQGSFGMFNLSGSNSLFDNFVVNVASIIPCISAQPPVAAAAADRDTATTSSIIIFNGFGSTSGDGIASFVWNFGDDTTDDGIIVTKTYTNAGTYTVTLTVTDICGSTNADEIIVTIVIPDATTPVIPDTTTKFVTYFDYFTMIAESGINISQSLFGAIAPVGHVDISTFRSFENTLIVQRQLIENLHSAYEQIFTNAISLEPMRDSFRFLSEYILETSGNNLNDYLSLQALKVSTTYAKIHRLATGEDISNSNIL